MINKFLTQILNQKDYKIKLFDNWKDNFTYEVETSDWEKFIIQQLSRKKSQNNLEFIEKVIDYSKNIQATKFANKFFENRFFDFDWITFQIMEKLEWKTVQEKDIDLDLIIKTAEYLANFHQWIKDFNTEKYTENNYYRRVFDYRDEAKKLIENSQDEEIIEVFNKMNSIISELKENDLIPKWVIHWDPAFKNFLIDENKNIKGLIDYDMVSVTAYLWDLADIIRWYLKNENFDKKAFNILIDRYNKIRPLTKEEKESLKDYCKMMVLDTWFRYIISYLDSSLQKSYLWWALEKAKRCLNEINKLNNIMSNTNEMYSIILAWWSGTRLWPISRKNYPKQFMKIGDKSLIQLTAERLLELNGDKDKIFINTNNDYKFHALENLKNYKINNLILEPEKRNNTAAIALILKYLEDIKNLDENSIIFLCPSDHIISPINKFKEIINSAVEYAKKWNIVLFWIKPTKPEIWYWYIKTKEDNENIWLEVDSFKEKPSFELAEQYLLDWNYYWNSWMLMFTIKTMKEEFEKYCRQITEFLQLDYNEFIRRFGEIDDISIDYSIMEKTKKGILIPAHITWSDVWSWDNIYEQSDKDNFWNSIKWNVILKKTNNSLVWTEERGRLVCVNWLNDLLVVDTKDALYITKKWESQNIKTVTTYLKEIKSREFEEHVTTHRPWWSYTILEERDNYKIKRITVNVWEKLSVQMHHHRSEHWTVVKWTAEVTIWKDKNNLEKKLVIDNESIYIPKTYIHSLHNVWKEVLEIIEVQVWSYLEEDDIVRFEDRYERK